MTIEGYDPLVAATPEHEAVLERLEADPISAARAYGVRWVLDYEPAKKWQFELNPAGSWSKEVTTPWEERELARLIAQAAPILRIPSVHLYRLAEPDPMAFRASEPTKALPVRFDWSGAHVDVSTVPENEQITINVLARPWMKVAASGGELKSAVDEWGRMTFRLKQHREGVNLTYSPPWQKAVLAGLVLIALALSSTVALLYTQKSRQTHRLPALASMMENHIAKGNGSARSM
jgi:hypothetical protein